VTPGGGFLKKPGTKLGRKAYINPNPKKEKGGNPLKPGKSPAESQKKSHRSLGTVVFFWFRKRRTGRKGWWIGRAGASNFGRKKHGHLKYVLPMLTRVAERKVRKKKNERAPERSPSQEQGRQDI